MAHKCEWCWQSVEALEAQEAEYTREISECDAEIERLGGARAFLNGYGELADEINGRAAAHEEDRAILRKCLESRG